MSRFSVDIAKNKTNKQKHNKIERKNIYSHLWMFGLCDLKISNWIQTAMYAIVDIYAFDLSPLANSLFAASLN